MVGLSVNQGRVGGRVARINHVEGDRSLGSSGGDDGIADVSLSLHDPDPCALLLQSDEIP